MKKLIIFLLTMVVVLSMFTGCRKQTNGTPGDPTVNNSTDAATVPNTSNKATRPSTEPTMHTTEPDATMNSGSDFTNGSDATEDATINSEARRRDRMMPRR